MKKNYFKKIVAVVMICLPVLNSWAQNGVANAFYGNKNMSATITITSCYVDEALDLKQQDGILAPLSDLQTQPFYENLGWNFNEIWQIEEGKFPIFKWQKYSSLSNKSVKKDELTYSVISRNNSIEITVYEPVALSVYNITGSLLYTGQVDNQVSIPATQGIYILKLKNTGKETVQKIIMK